MREAVRINGKMHRNKMQKNTDSVLMKCIDQLLELRRRTITAGRSKEASILDELSRLLKNFRIIEDGA